MSKFNKARFLTVIMLIALLPSAGSAQNCIDVIATFGRENQNSGNVFYIFENVLILSSETANINIRTFLGCELTSTVSSALIQGQNYNLCISPVTERDDVSFAKCIEH